MHFVPTEKKTLDKALENGRNIIILIIIIIVEVVEASAKARSISLREQANIIQ